MKKIFVAIDGSEHAWKALDYAAELAKGMRPDAGNRSFRP